MTEDETTTLIDAQYKYIVDELGHDSMNLGWGIGESHVETKLYGHATIHYVETYRKSGGIVHVHHTHKEHEETKHQIHADVMKMIEEQEKAGNPFVIEEYKPKKPKK